MATVFGGLALLVVVGHLAFVGFAAFGALLALRWPKIVWVHVPAAVWAVYVELSGRYCPLTPLENELRRRAGFTDYSGDFVARYIFPVLYPEGLTRDAQIVVGLVVLALNVACYTLIRRRLSPTRNAPHGSASSI